MVSCILTQVEEIAEENHTSFDDEEREVRSDCYPRCEIEVATPKLHRISSSKRYQEDEIYNESRVPPITIEPLSHHED
jgi:hypothetical protein